MMTRVKVRSWGLRVLTMMVTCVHIRVCQEKVKRKQLPVGPLHSATKRCVKVNRLICGVISKSDSHEHFAHVSDILAHFLFTLHYKLQNHKRLCSPRRCLLQQSLFLLILAHWQTCNGIPSPADSSSETSPPSGAAAASLGRHRRTTE